MIRMLDERGLGECRYVTEVIPSHTHTYTIEFSR